MKEQNSSEKDSEFYIGRGRSGRARSKTFSVDGDVPIAFQQVSIGLKLKLIEFKESRSKKFVPSLAIIDEDNVMNDFSEVIKLPSCYNKTFSDFDF